MNDQVSVADVQYVAGCHFKMKRGIFNFLVILLSFNDFHQTFETVASNYVYMETVIIIKIISIMTAFSSLVKMRVIGFGAANKSSFGNTVSGSMIISTMYFFLYDH